MKIIFILLFLLANTIIIQAQTNVKDSMINAPLIKVSYAYQLPVGELAKRFGNNSNVGIAFYYKTKRNFMFSADWNFIFSKNIKEPNVMQNLFTKSSGIIQNETGEPTEYTLYQRGWHSHINAGYVWNKIGNNKNSGLLLQFGLGILTHKIDIDALRDKTAQLNPQFTKGYDRLTAGPSSKLFIGYLYLDNRRLINVIAGFEFVQGYTSSLRKYNYDTQSYDTQKRIDLLNGIRLGIVLPLYKRKPRDFYFN